MTKSISLALFLFACCLLSATTRAEDNYISIKYGDVRSNLFLRDARFEHDNGKTKDVEFTWGSKEWARILGGVRIDSESKVGGYQVGVLFRNDDLISVQTYSTKDRLFKTDMFGHTVGTFGNVDAKTTEYTYLHKGQGQPEVYTAITYGKSNYPANVTVGDQGALSSGGAEFVDPAPKIEYLTIGVNADPIRASLLQGKEISEYDLANKYGYMGMKAGFGWMRTTLSSQQYSATYNINNYDLQNQKGSDPIMNVYGEAGFHAGTKTFKANAGIYYNTLMNFSMYRKSNKTPKGNYWYINPPYQWGLIARVAAVF